MPKVQTMCAECGKGIESFPSQKRRYCSMRCKGLGENRLRVAAGTARPPRPASRTGTDIICIACGATFYARAWELAKGRRYCSRACSGTKDRKPRTEHPCGYCGKILQLKPSAVASGRRFCSLRCRNLGATHGLTGRIHNGKPIKMNSLGYYMVWEAGRGPASMLGWYPEHRLIAEEALGRMLRSDEHVHHRNGIKDDNRLDNLEVLDQATHARLSLAEYSATLKRDQAELAEYRRRYGPLPPTP